LLFTRKEVFPLSPRPSLLFKKSGETFLFTFTYPCREQSLFAWQKEIHCDVRKTKEYRQLCVAGTLFTANVK
ncbi:MAG: hypothetical protein IJC21_08750, partial [Lentisphaeria bacterium]|nr:hypothetical protein [Lentisphaeria bacterium]